MTTANLNNQTNANNSSVVLAAQPSEMGIRQTMSSLEIAEEVGKPHNDLLKSIRKMEPAWTKVNGGKFSLVNYIDSKGELRPCYEFNHEEFVYVISKFDDERRARLVMRWGKVETGQAAPMYQIIQQPVQPQQTPTDYSLEEKFKAIELSCKTLRKSAASKTRMVNSIIVPMGLPAFDYVETEGVFLSAKDCLNKYPVTYKGKKLSAVTFNQIMIKQGYLEEIPHPKGRTSLKLLTEKGLKWGKNDSSTDHPNSITAHYDVKRFPELQKELGLK